MNDNEAVRVEDWSESQRAPGPTIVGWQGVRFTLPSEWNVTGFSMDHENGYLRVDAPGSSSMAVQVRWHRAAAPPSMGPPNLYSYLAPKMRVWLKRPEPPTPESDLAANLGKILKETAKQAKKAKSQFESVLRGEKIEGVDGERRSINFSWSGGGRGQGKIWQCSECGRVVVAQVLGLQKDQSAITTVAAQLFSEIRCHSSGGIDRWALYDLVVDVPSDFRLVEQKLLSGYLHLKFGRGAERIVLDRWGLANMALKKFTPEEWLQQHSPVRLKQLTRSEAQTSTGHTIERFSGPLKLWGRMRAFQEARASLRRLPGAYDAGVWLCEETNKLFAIQVWRSRKSPELWEEVVEHCVCH